MKHRLLRTGPVCLIGVFIIGACNGDDLVAPTEPPASPATPLSTWVSPQPCQIGLTFTPGTGYWYTLIPTASSVCGVGWTLYYPPNSDQYRGIYWFEDEPETPFRTLFSSGLYSGVLKGPVEITFTPAVKDFSLVVESRYRVYYPEYHVDPLQPGTYMVALDAAGQRLDSVDFDANVMVSEKTLAILGIKKILIYPHINRVDENWGPIPDEMVFRASFATMPPGELKCESSTGADVVTRGAPVTCTVTGAGVVVTGWTFTGPAYENPSTILRVTLAGGSNVWAGTAITGGDVAAQINVNSVPRLTPLTSSFSVQQRTGDAWSWGPNLHWKYTQDTGKNCGSGTMAYFEGTIVGWNRRTGGCTLGMLTPDPFTDSTRGYTVKAAPSGPNAGLWYVSALTYQMLRESQINQAVLPNSGLSYALVDANEKTECSAKAGKAITKANFYFFNATCKNLDVAGYVAGIRRHEGYGTTNGSGHQAQFEMTASLVEYSLYNNEEAVYAMTQKDARNTVVALARSIDDGIREQGGLEEPVDGKNWVGVLYLWAASQLKFIARLIYT